MDVNLVIFNKDGQRREIGVSEGVTLIGRGTECNVRIPVGEVSRKHAEVTLSDGVIVIKDLGSSNGTYVNVQRTEEQELEPGDKISIGPVVFTVQIDGEPEEIEPVRTSVEPHASSATEAGPDDSSEFGAELGAVDDDDDMLDALVEDADEETHIPFDEDDL